jgi:guanine nucleotide-binding protein subunit alpha
MRMIHSKGFKKNERKSFRDLIFQNIREALLMMFDIMDAQGIAFENPQNQVNKIR